MSGIRGERLAALTGVAFFALALIGRLVYPAEPGFGAPPGEIVAFYDDNEGALLASNSVYFLSVALLLWFAGYLRSALARAEGGDGRLAATAFGGAVAGAALMLAGGAADTMGALRVQEQGTIDPAVATALWDLNTVLFGLAAPMALAVAVLATAAVVLRTRALPVWLGAVSVALGVALAVPPINYVAIIAFLFWVLAASLALALREDRPLVT